MTERKPLASDGDSGRIGILGAGMLGLVLALRLAQRGERVTVLDAAAEVGGLASAWRVGDVHWDRYYHVISTSDLALLELLESLGIGSQVEFQTTRTRFFDGANSWPLDNALDYLRLPALGLVDKLRVGYTIVHASRIQDGRRLEQLGAEQWLTRLGGRSAWRALWRPLLRSKLGDNIDHVSAAYIWSVIRRFYGARHGSARREMFGYVHGGYGRVLEVLVERLRELGVEIVTGAAVMSVKRAAQGVAVEVAGGELRFRDAVVTFASPLAARVCADLDGEQAAAHRAIRYQGIVCASVLLRRALSNAYMTYITDESMPFTTVIEMSSLVDRKSLAGHHLAYLPCYVPAEDPLFDEADESIETRLVNGLLRMYPHLCRDDVLAVRITRNRHVMALPGMHYCARLPAMNTGVPGLWIANSAHIVNASLSVNESVTLAGDVARQLLDARTPPP